jgi:hypothetical protein
LRETRSTSTAPPAATNRSTFSISTPTQRSQHFSMWHSPHRDQVLRGHLTAELAERCRLSQVKPAILLMPIYRFFLWRSLRYPVPKWLLFFI